MSSSYRQIFKATSLIGGASLISGSVHLVQNKVVAVLLGAEGFALLEIYNSIIALISSIVNFGLGNSGVRQIAEAAGQDGPGGKTSISAVVTAYRHIIWITGALGVVLTVGMAPVLSRWFFKSPEYAWSIALLSIPLLLGILCSGQQCVIQGLRRIADLSKIRVWAALGGAMGAIPCYFLWGKNGIVIALTVIAGIMLGVTWLYARRINLEQVRLNAAEHRRILTPMLQLGLCFMSSSVIMAASQFVHKLLLTRMLGVDACGLYQAAYALSAFLIGFVLNAMGTDYYPRLVGLVTRPAEMARAINEQLEISLLLAIPALLGMMALAPWLVAVFYSASFTEAADLIRLFLFGILGQVFVWPLGYAVIAHGDGKLFVMLQLIPHSTHVLLLFLGIRYWGVQGAALSLFVNYLLSGGMMVGLLRCYYHVRFAWPVPVLTGAALIGLCGTLFLARSLTPWTQLWVNSGLAGAGGVLCLYVLVRRLNFSPRRLLEKRMKHGR
ncbi:MAG: O-antigen translocase [Lentisphaeria bacterium]|nr:O-antigen translocase [Lentisphaeria bacterium]